MRRVGMSRVVNDVVASFDMHHKQGAQQERAAIVAWLRALPAGNSDWCADRIEAGDHLTKGG